MSATTGRQAGTEALGKVAPRMVPELDPEFRPAVLAFHDFRKRAAAPSQGVPLTVALEQADGSVFRFPIRVFAAGQPGEAENLQYLERFVKCILWSRGGYRVYVSAAPMLGAALKQHFKDTVTGRFDADIMGGQIYEKPFEIVVCGEHEIPEAKESTKLLGRHLDGCRIGFDLGASDLKVAAVINGESVFTEEYPWNPVGEADPQYHFDHIMGALNVAAQHLPYVDAIGGSAAGVYVNNRVKVASLFRSVPPDLFRRRGKDLFLEMRQAWNNIPFEVVNDGEVTALAGSMALGSNCVLGVAMGSSEAGGYVTREGGITSWLNELAFVPVDIRDNGPQDEWSRDRGCGVQFFSQQGVGRLLMCSGLDVDPHLPLAEKLKQVQESLRKGDPRAAAIYRTIGVCFGYAAAHYADFYDVETFLVLGRVMTGEGGTLILQQAEKVFETEFSALAKRIRFQTPDERDKRHGQAIAAASLPVIASRA